MPRHRTGGGSRGGPVLPEHAFAAAQGPFDQAAPLAELAALVRRAGRSVMTFTGYYAGILTELDRTADRIEVTVDVTGQVAVNGWADPDQLDALRRELDVRPASDGRATRMRRR